jgi:hypothetical protein
MPQTPSILASPLTCVRSPFCSRTKPGPESGPATASLSAHANLAQAFGRHARLTRKRAGAFGTALIAVALLAAPAASAGTYPMYQCGSGTSAVAPGWSVFSFNTIASTVLSNTCANGGAIGDYVFSDNQPGAVTEAGTDGSEVGIAVTVPTSLPNITIASISANVIGSPATGDGAWLGFASAGESLPGAVELPSGTGSDYTANKKWSLPQGARDFEESVYCSTNESSPTCDFSDSAHVPALNDITLTLNDGVPPTVGDASGTLASAAAAGATVSGEQTLAFDAGDAGSGVRSATLTFSPEGSGAPYITTIDYGPQCSYNSWIACPVTQDASTFTVDTSALADETYAVQLSVTDAAGNDASDYLGTVTAKTVPHVPNGFPCADPQISLSVNGKARLGPVRYGSRVTVQGKLHCGTSPIPDAAVALSGTGVGGLLETNGQGGFSYMLPTGPSRTLTFRYFAYSDSTSPAASAGVQIGVYPSISLHINPRQTSNDGTIDWYGRVVGGPYPTGGLTLLVQVREGDRWQTFDQLLTHNGRFAYRYTFLRTPSTTTYAFRVALPASGAAGYDYLPSHSRVVRVHVSR